MEEQKTVDDLATLSVNDLARIVRATPGHFKHSVTEAAKAELARRGINWRPPVPSTEEVVIPKTGWPEWARIGLISVSFQILSRIFREWMSLSQALALAVAVMWLVLYLTLPKEVRVRSRKRAIFLLWGAAFIASILLTPYLWNWVRSL